MDKQFLLVKSHRCIVHFLSGISYFRVKRFGSQPQGGKSEQPVLGNSATLPEKAHLHVKLIFHTGQQDCGVDRKISGVLTSIN